MHNTVIYLSLYWSIPTYCFDWMSINFMFVLLLIVANWTSTTVAAIHVVRSSTWKRDHKTLATNQLHHVRDVTSNYLLHCLSEIVATCVSFHISCHYDTNSSAGSQHHQGSVPPASCTPLSYSWSAAHPWMTDITGGLASHVTTLRDDVGPIYCRSCALLDAERVTRRESQ